MFKVLDVFEMIGVTDVFEVIDVLELTYFLMIEMLHFWHHDTEWEANTT